MPLPVKSHRPEDAELSRKLEELAELQSRLADLELQLCNLRLELSDFENVYCAKVGSFYAELDEIEALIAERIAQTRPQDVQAKEAARTAREQADESRKVATEAVATPVKPKRSENIRQLFKSAAKQLHPDLARDDADRKTRDRLMTEANLAYANGDEARLRAILDEYESSPDTVIGEDVAAELVRTIRRINLAQKRIEQIETELEQIRASELFKLKMLVDDGTKSGKDVLGEMVERLKQQIQVRRNHLQSL